MPLIPRALRRATATLLFAAAIVAVTQTSAQPKSEPENTKAAAEQFGRGERAFRAGDFVGAGTAFEEAYRLSPHPDALWNAAGAWERAGELARAANLYAKYLAVAETGASDRGRVEKALARLANRLGRLEISAPPGAQITVDRAPASATTFYVSPGQHVVRLVDGARDESTPATVAAGRSVSVAFSPIVTNVPNVVLPPPLVTTPASESSPPRPAESHGWSPAVAFVSGGLTLAAAGFTVWSGLDTADERDAFDHSPSRESYDRGRTKQTRTNVALGATIGLAAVTAVIAIGLVEWRSPKSSVSVGAGPRVVDLRGSF